MGLFGPSRDVREMVNRWVDMSMDEREMPAVTDFFAQLIVKAHLDGYDAEELIRQESMKRRGM